MRVEPNESNLFQSFSKINNKKEVSVVLLDVDEVRSRTDIPHVLPTPFGSE